LCQFCHYKYTQNISDTRAPPLRLPYYPRHWVFHLYSNFSHIYTRTSFSNTTCISLENIILFHCSCIAQCNIFWQRSTWLFFLLSFNEIVSVFATILLWKPFLLNRL
jgi:hypothetical protein